MSTPPLDILPKQFHSEFASLLSNRSSNDLAPGILSEKMRFGDLENLGRDGRRLPDCLQHDHNEIQMLAQSVPTERAAASEQLLFLFWPGRSISDEGHLADIGDVLSAFQKGLLGARLSLAEARLTLHLLLGFGLRELSSLRPNSYEANRSCLKGIYSALGCNDQGNLLVLTYTHLVYALISRPQKRTERSRDVTTLLEETGYGDAKYHRMSFGEHEVALLELGAAEGHPVFLHHATRLPFFNQQHSEILHQANIRLLMLVRPGCLSPLPGPENVYEQQKLLGDALFFISTLAGPHRDITVVGHANGCVHALACADRVVNLKNFVLFLPTSTRSATGTVYGKLLDRIFYLARTNERVLNAYVWSFLELVRRDWVFDKITRHLHSDDSGDSAKVSREMSSPSMRAFFKEAYLRSASSIVLDAKAGFEINTDGLRSLNAKKTVFLGRQEPEDADRFAGCDIHKLEDVGQYASADAWNQFFKELQKII